MLGDSNLTIRRATVADCDTVARVHVASWNETYRGLIPDAYIDAMTEDKRAATWRGRFAQGEPLLLVAEAPDGDIVGFAEGGPRRGTELPSDAEVHAIYVLASAQKQGIGRALMGRLARSLADRGVKSVGAWVLNTNQPARAFYEHLGGRVAGEKTAAFGAVHLYEVAYVWQSLEALIGVRHP